MHIRILIAILLSLPCLSFVSGQARADSDQPTQSQKNVTARERGIRNVDKIGDRNVGCARGLGNWYSMGQQSEMGKQYSRQIDATNPFVHDPAITTYITRLGQHVVRNSDAQTPFTIKVIDSDEVNALALPGGYLYVTSGIILASENEAELAGIMAHEIAHVAACHAVRVRTRKEWMDLMSFPLTFIAGPVGYAALQGLSLATPFATMKYSRNFESQADFLAVQYVYKAGYDPQALLAFFEHIQNEDTRKRNRVVEAFRTHPHTLERIQKMKEEIRALLPPRYQYTLDTSEFEDMKALLNQYEDRRNGSYRKPGVPTLKRRVSTPEGRGH